MTARSPSAFLLSAMIHGLFAAAMLYTAYVLKDEVIDKGKIFELVAGEGDNFEQTEAPALGTPGGVKFELPAAAASAPAPVFTPPEPIAPAPEPVAPSPVQAVEPPKAQPKATPEPSPVVKAEAKPAAKTDPVVPNLVKSMKRVQVRIDAKQRAQRDREAKAAALAAKNAEIAAKKAELLAEGKTAGGGQSKLAKIDAEGIAAGVRGGSTNNKVGGAGGTALSRGEQDLLDSYFALLRKRLHEAQGKPTNGGDKLEATAEFHVSPAGTFSQVRIIKSSGDADFDQSVLDAFHKVSSIRRQDDQGELVRTVRFFMKDED